MKKIISLTLAAAVSLGLTGCDRIRTATRSAEEFALVDDTQYVMSADAGPAMPEQTRGASVALAVDEAGVEDGGRNAALWQGVQSFCTTFGFTAQNFTATEDGTDGAREALLQAADSGAKVVVCAGEDMADALYTVQDERSGVNFLLLDEEPHTDDYISYKTSANVHCVLFQEEQAAFLAGYAAVMEGYIDLGFVGTDEMPGVVRYCTGFLQGAEIAAEESGEQISVKVWYSGTQQASDEITARIAGWYAEGTQAVLAVDGEMAQCAFDATEGTAGRVIGADWNRAAMGTQVLTSAIKKYATVVQQQLYDYFQDGMTWTEDSAGQSDRLGVTDRAVGLPTAEWRFTTFTTDDYASIYERIRTSDVKVERYSDSDNLPETPNVVVFIQN